MLHIASSCLLALAARAKRHGVIVNEHVLTAEQTRRHAEALGRWFDFISLDELPGRLAAPRRRPFCLLTFDDGKRSNFTAAAPELERLGVPAVFYVTTGPVSDGGCLWFDRRERLARAMGHCPAELDLGALKRLPLEAIHKRLSAAEAAWKTPAGGSEEPLFMSWDEARSLARRGFAVGAHSVTHCILTRENGARAFSEIEESMARVGTELGAPCRTFAYPNGNGSAELAEHARRCGATTVMTTEPMWSGPDSCLLHLPRVQLFGEFSRARIELKIALAAVAGTLADPNGNGRAYRPANARTARVKSARIASCARLAPMPPARSGAASRREGGEKCRI